jgi:MFS superfamily sulfate permease-like transporter
MLFKNFYFHIFTCSLIWLNLPMDDPHFGLLPNWQKKALPHVPSPSTFHPCHVQSQLHSSMPCQLPSTFIHAMQTLRTVIHSGTIPSTFIHTSTLIFLVFRLWTQEVDVQTSYLLAGPACLWCLVLFYFVSWDLPNHPASCHALGIFGKLLMNRGSSRLFGVTLWKLLIIELSEN